jgi:protein-disulfide isomerase
VAGTFSPTERLQNLFQPWTSSVIVPLFALANAGVDLGGDVLREAASSPVTIGIVLGLVIGKPLGIIGVTWLVTRSRPGGLPLTVPWPPLVGAATVAGIGFTVSLLIADISFEGEVLEHAKLGILAASVLASLAAGAVFRVIARLPDRTKEGGAGRRRTNLVAPLVDLTQAVDPAVDHIRGPVDGRVTLVEYGDFECPYCGRAEPIVRDLVQMFGDDLTFVFRHLPLVDVHEHAELAAEAGEAAAAQGRFWEMHDALLAHQDALTTDALVHYAEELGLDVDRFVADLDSRHFALRVARDVESAEESGVRGTPTFFVNGRRHHGRYDQASLTAALRLELEGNRAGPTG